MHEHAVFARKAAFVPDAEQHAGHKNLSDLAVQRTPRYPAAPTEVVRQERIGETALAYRWAVRISPPYRQTGGASAMSGYIEGDINQIDDRGKHRIRRNDHAFLHRGSRGQGAPCRLATSSTRRLPNYFYASLKPDTWRRSLAIGYGARPRAKMFRTSRYSR